MQDIKIKLQSIPNLFSKLNEIQQRKEFHKFS